MEALKVGIEIHQQLDTNKLFCSCKSELTDKIPDFTIKRKLNAVAGETGKVDVAAEYESMKKKEYIYEAYNDRTCEIELDESPPRELNKEALKIALQIALFFHAKILSTTQIMRKNVVDGSNTSGFQRTMMIAKDGYVETKSGKVKVEVICLEEDAARKIKEDEKSVTFRLDRLGIPLVEVTTAPDIKSPEQTKEVAAKIGEILRACKVKRGIGTIRQDLNVNIDNHPRIEIKGFQDIRTMPETITKEIERQKTNPSKTGEVRKANPDATTTFLRPMPGASRMYPETDLPIIKITKEMIDEAKKSLPKLKHDIKKELEKYSISDDIMNQLIEEEKVELFEELIKIYDNPKVIARTLTQTMSSIDAHHKLDTEKIADDDLKETFLALKQNKISESMIEDIIIKICKGENIKDIISGKSESNLGSAEIELEIKELVKNKPGLSIGAYMGLLMQKFKGKADGKKLMQLLQKYL